MEPKRQQQSSARPPIIAVLGHVDHGKTTLLDFIRKTSVTTSEHGGITQHIGAYQISLPGVGKGHELITFIDTPGHEAFMAMRSRGAQVADIAILVVAADDSVKPQTKESIRIIGKAGIPMVVAVNKIDLPSANVTKVREDLARNSVQVEGFGGTVPMIPISAKTGKGVDGLLATLQKVAKTLTLPSLPKERFEAVVIETKVDKGKGIMATCLVKKGTLVRGTLLFAGDSQIGKVRAMFDENARTTESALPGSPVEVLGLSQLPVVGSVLYDIAHGEGVHKPQVEEKKPQIPDFLSEIPTEKTLPIILKADMAGSLEAIVSNLPSQITVVSKGVGEVTQQDILLAKSTKSFVIGFQVKMPGSVAKLAQTEGVVVRIYTLIYELVSELAEVVSGMEEVLLKERELGKGEIIAEFPYDEKRVAGTRVISGRIAKGDQVKVLREEKEVEKTRVRSLRVGKEDVTKVEEKKECGVMFDKVIDFAVGDVIIAFTTQ